VPEALTVDAVKQLVEDIRTLASEDDPKAHELEDALYKAVLESIAYGVVDAPALAREALKAKSVEFMRWTE
jgi:hypothetical protein